MSSGADAVDRLRAAIEAHECFVAERGRRSASEFLAEHEELRDLLEPLLARRKRTPWPSATGAPDAADAEDAAIAATPAAWVLGDFKLLGELGRGGMGVVYDAEQVSLGRRVAVKVLPGRLALDPDARARFEREARLAASLDHPGIAKVISADADDDVIWYAMERIDGAPLDRVLSQTADIEVARMTGDRLASVVGDIALHHGVDGMGAEPTTDDDSDSGRSHSTVWRRDYVATVVRIGAQIAAALDHAHQHGVVHRDVKPGNVLLRRDGTAVLTDFGLAREVAAPSLSLTGAFLGTPYYAAPEQLSGGRTDQRADVFALGVMLYELLTHRRPFEAPTSEEVRARILTVEPPRPRRFNRKISTDLSSVLLVALEKDPDQRYPTAMALADDLRAVAEGRPVRARPTRAYARVWRWCRRSPRAATALVLLAGVVVLLLTMRTQLVHANTRQAIRAGVALARAKDFKSAFTELMPLERRFPGAATLAATDELFRRFPCLATHRLVSEPGERVVKSRFSPDGRRVFTLHERSTELEHEERGFQVQLFRVPTPDVPVLQLLWKSDPCKGPLSVVQLDPGRTVAWTADDRTVCIGGPEQETATIEFAEPILYLVQASDPRYFGAGLRSRVELCDAEGPVGQAWSLPAPLGLVDTLVILGDQLIGTMNTESSWVVTSFPPVAGAKPVEIMRIAGAGLAQRPAIAPEFGDPSRMVVTTQSSVTTWRLGPGKAEMVNSRQNALPVWSWEYEFGGDELELAKDPGLARLEKLPLGNNHSPPRVFPARAGRSPETYVVVVEARVLRIWGLPEPRELDSRNDPLQTARFDPSGRRLWLAGGGAMLSEWPLDPGGTTSPVDMIPSGIRSLLVGQLHPPEFCAVAFDGRRAVLACARRSMGSSSPGWIVVLPTGAPERACVYPCRTVPNWVALSPDHRQLAIAGSDGGVDLREYDSARCRLSESAVALAKLQDAKRLSCMCYLDDRFLLASEGLYGGRGGILRWDVDDPGAAPVPVAPRGIRQALRCLAVSRDRTLVVTGGDDRSVRAMRVDWRDGKPCLESMWTGKHNSPVLAVAFAEREGTLILASADRYGGIRLWDARTGDERGIVRDAVNSDDEMILSLDFSPDGRYLAAALRMGRVLLWDMDRPRRCLEGNRDVAAQLLELDRKSP